MLAHAEVEAFSERSALRPIPKAGVSSRRSAQFANVPARCAGPSARLSVCSNCVLSISMTRVGAERAHMSGGDSKHLHALAEEAEVPFHFDPSICVNDSGYVEGKTRRKED